MSMRNVDMSMLGYRITRWRGVPLLHVGNGRVSIASHDGWGGGSLTNLYKLNWLMDEDLISFHYSLNYRILSGQQIDIEEGDNIGMLEDTNIMVASDSAVGGDPNVQMDVFYFAPMKTASYRDSLMVLLHLKNTGESPKQFYIGLYNKNDVLTDYVAYWKNDNIVKSKNPAEKTWIVGSPTSIDAVYMDGQWRTDTYVATFDEHYRIRWQITLDAGESKTLSIINTFGATESPALSLFLTLKDLDLAGLLEGEVSWWRQWLNEGKQWQTGVYEVDQLARLTLCLLKGSLDPDYYSMPAGITAYGDADWPQDTWLAFWAFALWGHHTEPKRFLDTRIRNLIDYIEQTQGKKIHRDLHITELYGYTCGSGYSGAEYFELPILAAKVYQLTEDSTFASVVWDWVKKIVDDMDANLVSSGDFEGCFNWNHINDAAVYEPWWLLGCPDTQKGTVCVTSAGTLWIANAYWHAAILAEAVGQYALAGNYKAKSAIMKEKVSSYLWNSSARQYWNYWSDVGGYQMMEEGRNNYAMVRGVPAVAEFMEPRIRESVLLHHYNLINLDRDPNETDNYLPSQAQGNWMLGKTEPAVYWGGNKIIDAHFWGLMFSCVKLGLDDLFEHWLNVVKDEYGTQDSFLFDEWSFWNGEPSSHYTMRRTMGMFLVILAEYFTRRKPMQQRIFEYRLERFSSPVTIFKPKDGGGYEARYNVKALIKHLRAQDDLVQAGLFTVHDVRAECRALIPISQGDRIKWGSFFFQVDTVQKDRFKDRVAKVECFCKRVIE